MNAVLNKNKAFVYLWSDFNYDYLLKTRLISQIYSNQIFMDILP